MLLDLSLLGMLLLRWDYMAYVIRNTLIESLPLASLMLFLRLYCRRHSYNYSALTILYLRLGVDYVLRKSPNPSGPRYRIIVKRQRLLKRRTVDEPSM